MNFYKYLYDIIFILSTRRVNNYAAIIIQPHPRT